MKDALLIVIFLASQLPVGFICVRLYCRSARSGGLGGRGDMDRSAPASGGAP